jgi:hypothetical protein
MGIRIRKILHKTSISPPPSWYDPIEIKASSIFLSKNRGGGQTKFVIQGVGWLVYGMGAKV